MSNSQDKEYATKVKIRPVKIKDVLYFQETIYRGTQVFHDNFSMEEILGRIEDLLAGKMKQCEITAQKMSATILVSKKGKMTIKTKKATNAQNSQSAAAPARDLSHNREKQYILNGSEPFLKHLGVSDSRGRVYDRKQAKFRQINRFLELIRDVEDQLPKNELRIFSRFASDSAILLNALPSSATSPFLLETSTLIEKSPFAKSFAALVIFFSG